MSEQKTGLATYEEVRNHLKIGKTSLYHLTRTGELKVIYVGSAPRIEWTEVDRYLNSRRHLSSVNS